MLSNESSSFPSSLQESLGLVLDLVDSNINDGPVLFIVLKD